MYKNKLTEKVQKSQSSQAKTNQDFQFPNIKNQKSESNIQNNLILPRKSQGQTSRADPAGNKQLNQQNFVQDFSKKLDQQEQEISKRDEMIDIIQTDFQKLQGMYTEEKQKNQDKMQQITSTKQLNEEL